MDPNQKQPLVPQTPVAPASQGGVALLIGQQNIIPGSIKVQSLAPSTAIHLGDLYYGDGQGNFAQLSPSATSQAVLQSNNGAPTWSQVYSQGLISATTLVKTSAAVAPTTGQVLTATSGTTADWETPAAVGAWTPWTPVWTLNTGTLTTTYTTQSGEYALVGANICIATFYMVLNTVTTATASKAFQVSLPKTPATSNAYMGIGSAVYLDSGVSFNALVPVVYDTGHAQFFGGGTGHADYFGADPAFTLETADTLGGTIIYQI